MNKILGVSIAAMLAVTPMLASAAGTAPTAAGTSSEPYLGVSVDAADQGHIASTAYVKGAYNAAIGATNAVSAAKQDKLMNNDATAAAAITGPVHVAVADANSASDTALVTEKAVRDAIDAVSDATSTTAGAGISKTNGKIAVDMTANGGLQMSDDSDAATLGVKVNTTTLEVDANGVGIKNAGVGTSQLANNAVATAKIADDAVTTAKILDANVTAAKLATDSVVTAKIADDAVTNAKIADDAVDTAQIVNEAVSLGKIASTAMVAPTNTTTYTETKLATGGYVDEKVATATNGMATQTGVVATLGSSYVTLYTDWAHQTYTQNVGITTPSGGYTDTVVTPPAGVSQ